MAKNILRGLKEDGVRTLCLCPGARNAPFIELLAKNSEFELLSFYDERSAGFFALGRAQRDQAPVAVITTSGTAVSELLSPVIEAHYTQTPLVIISADRPKRLRGTGAPQAIEQAKIFQNYAKQSFDIEAGPEFSFKLSGDGPNHINCCFDEPLVDTPVESWETGVSSSRNLNEKKNKVQLEGKFHKAVVLIGKLSPSEAENLESQLQPLNIPIFAEASSGLRGSEKIKDTLLWGGEKIVSKLLKSGEVESVLRLGDVPLGRFWRDLDQLDIPTLSLSSKKFSGTEKSMLQAVDLSQVQLNQENLPSWEWRQWQSEGYEKAEKINQLIQKFPESEVAQFSQLSSQISSDDFLYIGNSLPVREWDLVEKNSRFISTNRGANGIDGQLSSALGAMEEGKTHWVILGDLTALYDFSGFWVSPYLREKNIQVNLVVINNQGGQIFSRIFENRLFRNEHNINLKGVAETWGWNYQEVKGTIDAVKTSGLTLIECFPKVESTQSFWQEYDQIWK